MKMKRIIGILLVVCISAVLFTACSGGTKYKDGVYTAEDSDFDSVTGWKENVTIVVTAGKISSVDWNGTHTEGGTDKKTRSSSGEYGMVAGGAQAEWHEQAAKMEAELIKEQDPNKIKVSGEGLPDAVSGVTIHVSNFVMLCNKALSTAK